MSLTDTAVSITGVIGSVARFGSRAAPVVATLAAFIPALAPAVPVLAAAGPILDKIATAAPIAVDAINAGRPILEAIERTGPELLPALKRLYAAAVNADPARPEIGLAPKDVSEQAALRFAGPVLMGRTWTAEEEARWFDTAKGDVSNA